MKFQRRFYKNTVNFQELAVQKVVVGIVLGLLSAFVIYSFFYVIREVYRILSLGLMDYGFRHFNNGEYILSHADRSFYNLFFAGLSLILGHSIAILFIFSGSNKVLSRRDSRKKRLLNDQVFLAFNFSYWFTKIGLVFGVFSMCCMDFEFLPYFKPLAFLLLLVLYLDTWKSLARLLEKNRYKIQMVHLIIMLGLTYVLSKVDTVNYKVIDQTSITNNPVIDFPTASFYNEKAYNYLDIRIAFKLKLNDNGELEIYTEDRNKINLKDIVYEVNSKRASLRDEFVYLISGCILADADLNIRHIKMVEAELYLAGIQKIDYEIYTVNLNGGFYFDNHIITKINNKSVLNFKSKIIVKNDSIIRIKLPPLPPPPPEIEFVDHDTLTVLVSKRLKSEVISKELMSRINSKTLFLYKFNAETTYQDYINTISAHSATAFQLRKNEQTLFNDNCYDTQCYETYLAEQRKLREKYPIKIIENFN